MTITKFDIESIVKVLSDNMIAIIKLEQSKMVKIIKNRRGNQFMLNLYRYI